MGDVDPARLRKGRRHRSFSGPLPILASFFFGALPILASLFFRGPYPESQRLSGNAFGDTTPEV